MTVYAVATITIHDRETYAKYEAGFMQIFEQHQGKILAVDENPHLLEGNWPHTRTVLIEFANEEQLSAWYTSADYQALAQHRFAASAGNVVVLQGLAT